MDFESEDSIAESMASPTLASRTVDVNSLPSDSLLRVAEMSRARRARLLAEEESWIEESNFNDKQDEYLQKELMIIAADEDTARGLFRKTEEKAFDRIMRQHAEHNLNLHDADSRFHQRREFERRKEAEIRRLQQELHRKSFQSFWEEEKKHPSERSRRKAANNPYMSSAEDPDTRLNKATGILRLAYEHSLPPFVTDPEEVWRRGVTVAPDLRSPGYGSPDRGATSRYHEGDSIGAELNLPSFHEYGQKLREKFFEAKQKQQQQQQQQQPNMSSNYSNNTRWGSY